MKSEHFSSVEVEIEELILHGFAPGDRYSIGEAVERELTRLFTEQGVPATLEISRAIEISDAGAFQMRANARGENIGGEIAQTVYKGLDSPR